MIRSLNASMLRAPMMVLKTASQMHVAPRIVVHCWQHAPDVVPDTPYMMPQTCLRWCPRHAPDDAPDMPELSNLLVSPNSVQKGSSVLSIYSEFWTMQAIAIQSKGATMKRSLRQHRCMSVTYVTKQERNHLVCQSNIDVLCWLKSPRSCMWSANSKQHCKP